jgi:hypothetical protein
VASDSSMCPGVGAASKNEYQVNPGGKGGRCIRLTTYHLHVPMSRNLGALTSWNPVGLFRPVMGLFTFLCLINVHLLVKRNFDVMKMRGTTIKTVVRVTCHITRSGSECTFCYKINSNHVSANK